MNICIAHESLEQRFGTSALQEFLKHAIPDYLVRGTNLFSLRLSNTKNYTSQHNNSPLVWMNENYTYFCQISKMYICWCVCPNYFICIFDVYLWGSSVQQSSPGHHGWEWIYQDMICLGRKGWPVSQGRKASSLSLSGLSLGLVCIGMQGVYVKLFSHCQAVMIKG